MDQNQVMKMTVINHNERRMLVSGHEIRRCPSCDSLNVEILKIGGTRVVICANKNCNMTGPHRRRVKDCVDAWNALPRRSDVKVTELVIVKKPN